MWDRIGVNVSLHKALKSGFGILQTGEKCIPGAVCWQTRENSWTVKSLLK